MYLYNLTTDELVRFMNQAKETTVQSLCQEGFLTEEQRDQILGNYAIVIHKKNWFGEILGKVRNLVSSTEKDHDTIYINLVKLINIPADK